MAVLAFISTPSPIMSSVSRDVESTAMRDAKEPPKAQTDAHAVYTVHVVKATTFRAQSATPIRSIAAKGRAKAVESSPNFGGRCGRIPMPGKNSVTLKSSFTVMVTNFTDHSISEQEYMRVPIHADIPPCVVYLRDTSITAGQEASNIAVASIDYQASLVPY